MEGDTKTPQGLTLQELADRTGVEPRTIRSYVEKGVIPGPDTLGRGARYPRETLARLQVLQLLRDANRALTLDQIRVLLQRLGPSQLAAIAAGSLRIGAVIDTDAAGVTPHPKTAAMDYLRTLRHASLETPSVPLQSPDTWNLGQPPSDHDDLSVLENAARALAALAGGSSSSRSTRGERWYRISLTPDIELSVRGEFDTEQLAQLHRIGDSLRTLLTKGPCT
ncbi:MAG: MerR family transcriptional regulator [Planctomycetia bacterium]